MRNWLLAFALLGCSGDPDVVVYVVNAEGGSSSVGGATEIDETDSSVGGKPSASSLSAIAGSGGSSQSSGSYGGSSTTLSASFGGSSSQASQTSRALTIAAGGSYQLTQITTVVTTGGSTQATTTTPTAPPQDCRIGTSMVLCGPGSLGTSVCDADGQCVKLEGLGEYVTKGAKLDCNYDGIPETVVGDENCGHCWQSCPEYTECVIRWGATPDGDQYTEWACD